MFRRVTLLLLLFHMTLFSYSQTKKRHKKQHLIAVLQTLPDSIFQKFPTCNGVDVVLFFASKSMEFNDKNAQAPVSFITREGVKNTEGYKHIGLFTYKINGSVFMDCDILMNEQTQDIIMKFRTKEKEIYYQKMNEDGKKLMLQWLKK